VANAGRVEMMVRGPADAVALAVCVRILLIAVVACLSGCAVFPSGYARTETAAWPHPEETAIGRALAGRLQRQASLSGVRLLETGVDAFAARAALADVAERTLDLQYYIVRDDESTIALLSRVVAAADRGVRVRLLVDDIYAVGRDFGFGAFASHPNIEVRVFNPFLRRGPLGLSRLFEVIGDADRLNHRMHNKTFVADNAAAVIGGRNLGNEYFAAQADAGYIDLDVLAVGPVVGDVSASFDQYWASSLAVPIEAFPIAMPTREEALRGLASMRSVEERLRGSEYAERLRRGSFAAELTAGVIEFEWAPAIALYDPPDKLERAGEESAIVAGLRPVIDGAQRELFLVSPYFVPGAAGLAALRKLRSRGLRVRVLTNSLASTDVPVVYAGYSRYQVALLESGVELWELRPVGGTERAQEAISEALGAERAALHAKTFVVDARYVFVGSMNLDPRSNRINTEFGMLVDSPALAARLLGRLSRLASTAGSYRAVLEHGALAWITMQDGREVRFSVPPDTGAFRRAWSHVLRLVAPEQLL
jgi:putative cardiolipin synthase